MLRPQFTKTAIVAFVEKVTRENSPDLVPVPERIATFDNDGTLWCEQPMYFQLLFALDRVKTLAPQHPEWKAKEPFASLLKGDPANALAGGDQAGKPVGINSHIGRRPIAAFGSSDGDRQMLEWTQAGGGARLMLLVHHDDGQRELEYGAKSHSGTFSDSLMDEAKKSGWTVISMKDDWRAPFSTSPGSK